MLKAARSVRGLFLRPGDPGYNPDADVPWNQLSGRTRAALILTQGAMAAERAKMQAESAPTVLGMIVMPAQLSDPNEWEKSAARLAEARKQHAIEAQVVEAKEGEGK